MTPLATAGVPPPVVLSGTPAVVHIGTHTTGVPEQPADPAGSNAATYAPPWLGTMPSPSPATYSTPLATTGESGPGENPGPVDKCVLVAHRGAHSFGVPEQFVVPAVLKAWTPSPSVTKTSPSAMVMPSKRLVGAVHRGEQVVGMSTHPVFPVASNASSWLPTSA